jgi:hypothetical protein
MLEEYIKRLENLIIPHNFSKTNFREKLKAEFEDPAEIEERKKKNYNTEALKDVQSELVDEYIQKMGVKETEEAKNHPSSDNKIKIYQRILDNEAEQAQQETNEAALSQNSKVNKTFSLSPSRRLKTGNYDEATLREKVHSLNIKAMNYRHEVETLKNKILELNKKIDDQQGEIQKMEKQRESSNKYLIKLETLLAHNNTELKSSSYLYTNNNTQANNLNNSKLNNSKFAQMNNSKDSKENWTVELNKLNHLGIDEKSNNVRINLNDKAETRDYITNLIQENQKLKSFQNGVFEISKKYDDINENMIEGMKQIQIILNNNKKENERNVDENTKKDIIKNFEKLVENVEKTIEIKQSEYNFLIESKEQEMKFLQDEIIKLNENMETVKRDRLRDQKVLIDYETEIAHLNNRIEEIQLKNNENTVKEENQNSKLQV